MQGIGTVPSSHIRGHMRLSSHSIANHRHPFPHPNLLVIAPPPYSGKRINRRFTVESSDKKGPKPACISPGRVSLIRVSLTGPHFTGVYLTGYATQGRVYTIDVPLSRASLAGMYPTGMHLISVHLIDVHS